MKLRKTENQQEKKKGGRLFLLIGSFIAGIVVFFNVVQIRFITKTTKEEIKKTTEFEYTQFVETYANLEKNVVEKYFAALDYYCNSDVIKGNASTEEIVSWLRDHEQNRNKDFFDYVAWVDKDGLYYSDIGTQTIVSDRDYFKEIMQNGADSYIDNPVPSKVSWKTVVHVCRAAKRNGETIGFFCGNVEESNFAKVLEDINLGSIGEAGLFSSIGKVIASNLNSEALKEEVDYIRKNDPASYSVFQTAWANDSHSGTIKNSSGENIVIFSKIVKHTPWKIMLFLKETEINATATAIFYKLLICGIIITVVIVLFAGFIMYKQIKPLRVVENTIRGIATGDADLTQRIELKSNNEIGRVVEGFNKFSEKLHVIVSTMKQSKNELVEVDELLQNSTEDTVAAITQIISNIQSMDKEIGVQSESVHETAGAVNEIASNIESLNRMIESQSAAVTQASASVEEMIGNINSVNNSVQRMAHTFHELEEKAATGIQKNNDVTAKIEEIQAESQALREANVVINGIAEQTNLLAMNAAIEAAHAGEAGRGFSVVADEIRKLSEDSGSQSQTIGNQLDKIINSIEQMVDASGIASDAFNDVAQEINLTNNLVQEISNAMIEQNEGSKQIAVALNSMNDTSNEVKTASLEMAEGNKAILDEIKNLQEATFSIKDGMGEMSSGARKINETGAALSELTNRMKTSIKQIGVQVDQFRV